MRVNKSQLIRDYLQEHPEALPRDVAKALTKGKLTITPAFVSNVKQKLKDTNGRGPSGNDALIVAAEFVRVSGGLKQAKRNLTVMEDLMRRCAVQS